MREGAEVVLFLYGIVVASHTSAVSLTAGGAAGLALAAVISWLLYRGLVIIPLHRLFQVTNGLIALLAAGMAGQAAAVLHSADLLPGWGEQLWNTSFILADDSFARPQPARPGRLFRPAVGHPVRRLARDATGAGGRLPHDLSKPRVRTVAAAAVLATLMAGRARRPAPMICPCWCSTTTASNRPASRCRPT